MAVLASVVNDPASLVTNSTTAARAIVDPINATTLRVTFTAPASGAVLVRMRCSTGGGTTYPQVLLAVMSGTTVLGRVAPKSKLTGAGTNIRANLSAVFIVKGLTPGSTQTWDAAAGVETGVTSTGMKYGGANDTTANNAFGGFTFEVFEA